MNGVALDQAPGVAVVRRIFIAGLAGMASGFLVGGVGGRLAMRLTSLVDRSAHGARTEAGFTVGEVTLAGTLELVVFVGLFTGIAVTAAFPVVERWLPRWGPGRWMLAGLAAAAIGGRLAIDGRNIDFLILDPGWLMAAIFVTLTALVGVVAVAVISALERRLSHGEFWGRAWPALLVLGALPAAFWIIVPFDSDSANVSRPWLASIVLYALAGYTVVTWVREFRGRPPSERWERSGRALLLAVIVTGALHLGGEIAHFV